MANYSGKTSIEYEIERYKNSISGEVLEASELDDNFSEDVWKYSVIPLTVTGSAYFTQGKTYGPPESSYPDEGDSEILTAVSADGKDWLDDLTKSEKESMLEIIVEVVQEQDNFSDPDDYYDGDD